ncbi:MAG TPA: AsmA-like C-terminal region-containing protein [Candidatus Omnitrophota bacterium]|nr:AsmA-like C-terminal region-containing protein [Candidatus Omnitrophota bacterium]
MKKRYQFLILIVLVAAFFILGLWFQTKRLLPSPKIQEMLVQKIQTLTEGTLRYQGFQVAYFPQPQLILESPQLTFVNESLKVEAEKISFDFSILPLFLGRADPVAFFIQSGEANFSLPFSSFMSPVKLENFSLQIGAIRPKMPIPLNFVSSVNGQSKVFSVKGYAILDSIEKWDWLKAVGHFIAEIKELSMNHVAKENNYDPKRSFLFKAGQINTLMEIHKKANEAFLELKASGSGKGLTYEVLQEKEWVIPPSLDMEWDVSAHWNHNTEELKLQKMKIKMPFGDFEANGGLKLSTGEIAGMHLTGSQMVLENLLKYWPRLEKALPFHIGFSGPNKWALSLEGTLDHLSVHLNWALAQTLLTYGQYFFKPKDVPLDLSMDVLVQKGETISGDFSLKFQDMSLKGTLADLNIKTGRGQLNLITNKFSMTGWEEYIPALANYKLAGDAKILADWKGDLLKLEKAERILNVTIEQGALTTSEGKGISNAVLSIDYSPLMFEARQMQFDLGGSRLMADLKITGDFEKIKAEGKLTSEELKPFEAWQSVAAIFQDKSKKSEPDIYDQVKESLGNLFPGDRSLKNLSTEIEYSDKKAAITSLKFESYEGQANLKGWIHYHGKEPSYYGEGEIQGLNLGLFLSRQDASLKILEGTLSLKGKLEGAGWDKNIGAKSLKGQGELMVTKGRFQSFDLKNVIAAIEPLSRIKDAVPSLSEFDSMNLHWQVSDEKISTDDLLIKSRDYIIDGEGTLGFDGLMNFRTDNFLSAELASKILPGMASSLSKETKAHLGPIPILLSGALSSPELKPDPAQVENLVKKIFRGNVKDILCELVIE